MSQDSVTRDHIPNYCTYLSRLEMSWETLIFCKLTNSSYCFDTLVLPTNMALPPWSVHLALCFSKFAEIKSVLAGQRFLHTHERLYLGSLTASPCSSRAHPTAGGEVQLWGWLSPRASMCRERRARIMNPKRFHAQVQGGGARDATSRNQQELTEGVSWEGPG